MLTRTTYVGHHEFNKSSPKSGQKPAGEVVTAEVPPLIDQATFDAVQAHLRARNPRVTPARVVSGPTLLTGICFCAACGGAMTLRTGKGGRYRYYTCSIKARQGETGCKGRSIPMEKLDDLVAGHIEDRLLQPERLEEVLASVLDRRQERAERRREHIAELNQRAAEADLRLKRLYDAIESGVADLDDPALKDRIAGLKSTRDQAQADAERTAAALESAGQQTITPAMVRKFAATARERIRIAGGGYRRDHLRALAQRVEVADGEVRIMGSKGDLLRTLAAACGRKIAHARRSQFCSEMASRTGIRTRVTTVKGWCPGPLDERDGDASALGSGPRLQARREPGSSQGRVGDHEPGRAGAVPSIEPRGGRRDATAGRPLQERGAKRAVARRGTAPP